MTLSRKEVAAFFERSGGHPSRALGQNFVVDANTVRKIARLADINEHTKVVEIGAGLGSLTRAVAELGASVIAVEIDKYLVDELRTNTKMFERVTVVHADAMTLDWNELLPVSEGPYVLIANLPYNVATPLVCDLLDDVPQIQRMLVMVQKEVGDRLAAVAGSEAYGAVSVKVAYHATAKIVGFVPPTVFLPQPKVDSGLVRIDRRSEPAVSSELVSAQRMFTVVKAGFAQRRKMLRRALIDAVSPDAFALAGIEGTTRAEQLNVEQWGRLAAVPFPAAVSAVSALSAVSAEAVSAEGLIQ
jgi:16S rRNA (adenine1518-N6/adenine1519-N6)-dimethyltransferase